MRLVDAVAAVDAEHDDGDRIMVLVVDDGKQTMAVAMVLVLVMTVVMMAVMKKSSHHHFMWQSAMRGVRRHARRRGM